MRRGEGGYGLCGRFLPSDLSAPPRPLHPVPNPYPPSSPSPGLSQLYFVLLELGLTKEQASGGEVAVKTLLHSSKLHKGLVACCVELVAASHR